MNECSIGRLILTGQKWSFRQKPALMPLCPPQIHQLAFMPTGWRLIVWAKIRHHTFLKHLIHIQPCSCYVQGVSASKTQVNTLIVSNPFPALLLKIISSLLTKPPSSFSRLLCVTFCASTCYQRCGTHFAVHNKSTQCVHDLTTQYTPTIFTSLMDNCRVAEQTFLKL